MHLVGDYCIFDGKMMCTVVGKLCVHGEGMMCVCVVRI